MFMALTLRQQKILEALVRYYVEEALPVSSEALVQRFRFSVSPATVRNEFFALMEEGYIAQPHTSAGRVPTALAYRFFVDMQTQKAGEEAETAVRISSSAHSAQSLAQVQEMLEDMAVFTRTLSAFWLRGDLFLDAGTKAVLREPEFKEVDRAQRFFEGVSLFRQWLEHHPRACPSGEVRVFIGTEHPLSELEEFSTVMSAFGAGERGGVVFSLGPMRMDYHRTVSAVHDFAQRLSRVIFL